ncbi:MAG: CoxG family protein [Bacillota bacterium]
MRVVGSYLYDAPPELIYQVFTNPDALVNATPGLQSLRELEPDSWEGEIKVGVGGFALLYRGIVRVLDREPDRGYRITIHAETHNGSVEAETRLRFEPQEDGGTRVVYETDVEFRGGQKLLPAIARGLVEFFMRGIEEYLMNKRLIPAQRSRR